MQIKSYGKMWKFLSIVQTNNYMLRMARNGSEPLDVCTLRLMFIKATLLWILMGFVSIVAAGFIAYVMSDTFAFITAIILYGWMTPNAGAATILAFLLIGFFISVCILLGKGAESITESNVGVMVKSWREKYCEKVEIV